VTSKSAASDNVMSSRNQMYEIARVSLPLNGGDESKPYSFIASFREDKPICVVTLPQGGEAWLISRYNVMLDLLTDRRLSRNPPDREGSIPYERLRRWMVTALPKRVALELRSFVDDTISALLSQIRKRRQADLVADFSLPLSGATLAELFGVPAADRPIVTRQALTVPPLASHADNCVTRQEALEWLTGYFTALAAKKTRIPGPDLLSRLVAIEGNDRPTMKEIADVAIMLFVAGHEPTANLISSSLLVLLQNQGLLAQLRFQPRLISNAVEELIRYDNPVFPGIFRYALEDFSVDDQLICKGDLVLLPVFAAGRDSQSCAEPEMIDLHREPIRNLTFGYGPHYCLGVALATMQLTAAVDAFVRLCPDVDLRTGPDRPRWSTRPVRALLSVPIGWLS
jgi:cytochrome P450